MLLTAVAVVTSAVVLLAPMGAEAEQPCVTEAGHRVASAVDSAAHAAASPPQARGPDARLVERARTEQWSADRLFEHLGLDDLDACGAYQNRAQLRIRTDRWNRAVALLDRIDPEALDAWILGLDDPPSTVVAETEHHLECLIEALLDAAGEPGSGVAVFPDLSEHFGSRFDSTGQFVRTVQQSPSWLDRAVDALLRSHHRPMRSQAWIWHRKFQFRGRAFNRISNEAAERCSLGNARLWRPDSQRHQHCWNDVLSPAERQREILVATAAPGLSRHHWGTDVDILGLNPTHFNEGGFYHGAWEWLDRRGLDYGFFQTYRNTAALGSHFEERWHWSYYPIGQGIWEFIRDNPNRFETALFEQWDDFERRWGRRRGPYFDYIREHWRRYVFGIAVPRR